MQASLTISGQAWYFQMILDWLGPVKYMVLIIITEYLYFSTVLMNIVEGFLYDLTVPITETVSRYPNFISYTNIELYTT